MISCQYSSGITSVAFLLSFVEDKHLLPRPFFFTISETVVFIVIPFPQISTLSSQNRIIT
jgi:hypothetical protein